MKRIDQLIELLRAIYTLLQQYTESHPVPPGAQAEPGEYLEPWEVQKRLGISERTFYRHLKQGVLVPRRVGKRIFFYPSDLEAAIRESKRRGRL